MARLNIFSAKKINGEFKCPVTVIGGAESDLMVDVQKSFYEYIEDISTKTDLRLQYNSWYDYMKDITADNIEKSFYEIERDLHQTASRRLMHM